MAVRVPGRDRRSEVHPSRWKSFFLWQLLRKPNHGYGFYLDTSLPDLGILVIAVAVATLVSLRHERSWRETLLLCWIGVPFVFFEPGRRRGTSTSCPSRRRWRCSPARGLAVATAPDGGRAGARATAVVFTVVAISLVVPSWSSINTESRSSSLAGSGGLPAGRETGRWVRTTFPKASQMLAIGPSMANVLEFYGNRKVWGLSVSSNPRHRNPVYQPVTNPDLVIREGTIQYVVWDAYSADRSKRIVGSTVGVRQQVPRPVDPRGDDPGPTRACHPHLRGTAMRSLALAFVGGHAS